MGVTSQSWWPHALLTPTYCVTVQLEVITPYVCAESLKFGIGLGPGGGPLQPQDSLGPMINPVIRCHQLSTSDAAAGELLLRHFAESLDKGCLQMTEYSLYRSAIGCINATLSGSALRKLSRLYSHGSSLGLAINGNRRTNPIQDSMWPQSPVNGLCTTRNLRDSGY